MESVPGQCKLAPVAKSIQGIAMEVHGERGSAEFDPCLFAGKADQHVGVLVSMRKSNAHIRTEAAAHSSARVRLECASFD